MLTIIFRSMLVTSLRDRITLFYSLAFPLVIMIGLGLYFDEGEMPVRIVTGVTAISTIFWGMQGIAFQVHFQRNKGVYKLLRLTPMPTISFIIIMILARTFIGIMLNIMVWFIGMFFLQIDFGFLTFAATLLLVVIGTLCFTSIGFFIANMANNEGQINMFSNLLQIPMIFMSEAFYSLNSAPDWVATVGKLLPFEYYVLGLRGIVNGDENTLLLGVMVPIIYMFVALILSALTFKWEGNNMRIGNKRGKIAS